MKIEIVLLYGLYFDDRKDYKEYLDYISNEIQKEKFDKIILCGGHTNPNRITES